MSQSIKQSIGGSQIKKKSTKLLVNIGALNELSLNNLLKTFQKPTSFDYSLKIKYGGSEEQVLQVQHCYINNQYCTLFMNDPTKEIYEFTASDFLITNLKQLSLKDLMFFISSGYYDLQTEHVYSIILAALQFECLPLVKEIIKKALNDTNLLKNKLSILFIWHVTKQKLNNIPQKQELFLAIIKENWDLMYEGQNNVIEAYRQMSLDCFDYILYTLIQVHPNSLPVYYRIFLLFKQTKRDDNMKHDIIIRQKLQRDISQIYVQLTKELYTSQNFQDCLQDIEQDVVAPILHQVISSFQLKQNSKGFHFIHTQECDQIQSMIKPQRCDHRVCVNCLYNYFVYKTQDNFLQSKKIDGYTIRCLSRLVDHNLCKEVYSRRDVEELLEEKKSIELTQRENQRC